MTKIRVDTLLNKYNDLARDLGKPELKCWNKGKPLLKARIKELEKASNWRVPDVNEIVENVLTLTDKHREEAANGNISNKPAYEHPSNLRCKVRVSGNNRPRFISAPCGGLMKVRRTMEGGKVKQWMCPKCGSKKPTIGKEI